MIAGRNATFRFTGGLTNHGSVGLSFGTSDVFGDIDNAAGGRIAVSGAGSASFYDDLINDGEVSVSAGASAVYFGAVTGAGSFTGAGTNYFEGDLRPGHSAAAISFGGGVVFGPWAALAVEIGGNAPGSEHDQLNVAGQVSLDGALDVELIDGFVPEPGDVFEIITAGARSGEFASAAGLDDLGGFAGLDFVLSYEPDAVELLASAHKGDANLDAKVDVLDLARLANHFGKTPAKWTDSDFNGDDKVDVLDLAILANHFGWAGGSTALAASGGGPVPEPAALAMLALGAAALIRRRKL